MGGHEDRDRVSCLNKAVMEVDAKQGGSQADVLFEDLLQVLSDNRLNLRAARVVKFP